MPEMYLRQPAYAYSVYILLTKNKQEHKNSKQQNTLGISIRKNYRRSVFNTIFCMKISNIYQEERRLTKHYVTRYSKSLVIQSTMGINVGLQKWSTNVFIIRLEILILIQEEKSMRVKKWTMSYKGP